MSLAHSSSLTGMNKALSGRMSSGSLDCGILLSSNDSPSSTPIQPDTALPTMNHFEFKVAYDELEALEVPSLAIFPPLDGGGWLLITGIKHEQQ